MSKSEIKKIVVNLADLKEYADYGSIKQELDVIIRYFKIAKAMQNTSDDDAYQIDALATAALVKYARIFKSGLRKKISPDEIGFDNFELEAHKHFIHLRDKHISHSVNEYEQGKVVAFLDINDNGEISVSGIASEPSRVLMTQKNICGIYILATKTHDYIQQLLIEKYQEALEVVRSQSDDYLMACPEPQPMEVDPSKVGHSRKYPRLS